VNSTTFAAQSIPPEPLPADPFGDSFVKLAFLLGLPEEAPILQLGMPFFPHIRGAAETGSYGLATWQRPRREEGGLVPRLLEIRRMLAADASLLLLADNPFYLRQASRQPQRLYERLWLGVPGVHRSLRQAGFGQVAEFWALPREQQPPEEFHLRSPQGAQPRSFDGHPLKRLMQKLQLGHLLQDRFLYLASAPGKGVAATLACLEERLAPADGSGRLVLERFDLRRRGALVMICSDSRSGRRLVFRMAPSGEVAEVVGRNHQWIERLHGGEGKTADIKEWIPRPLAAFSMRGAKIFVEEALEGELAWKVVARKGLRRTVLTAACDFLWSLHQRTAVENPLDDVLLDCLLPEPKDWPERRCGELGAALTDALRHRLHGQRRLLVWGHGDFGYGNLLVDPRHGHLKGVIDWDTGTLHELAGLDLVHLLVQRARIEQGRTFSTALIEVGTALLENGPAAIASDPACAMLQTLSIDNLEEILVLCCLRFVNRSARYPTVFAQDLHQNIDALTWALGLLDHGHGFG
jgi:hypothetical protein